MKVAIGNRYERLVVVALVQDKKNPRARCLCDCGATVEPQRGALVNGRAKSCGCLRRELLTAHVERIKLPAGERAERKAKAHADWCGKNRERWREINNAATRKHHANNPETARRSCQARRARQAGLMGAVSKDIRERLLFKQAGKCACCRKRLRTGDTHLDHVIPLALGGLHEDVNLQLLCQACNLSKGARHPNEFMQTRGFLL